VGVREYTLVVCNAMREVNESAVSAVFSFARISVEREETERAVQGRQALLSDKVNRSSAK
jgi:hypothetical protein